MNTYDLTNQVLERLDWYTSRIAQLQSDGRLDDAQVLANSASLMAEYADTQRDWLVVE